MGDLFHSKYSIDKTLQKKVEDLPELLTTNVELVLGNHDVGCDIKNIKIFDIKKTKNITFSHEPINLCLLSYFFQVKIDDKKFIQLMPLSSADNPRYKKNKHIL